MSINVSKPKFFMNELQFQDSIGNLEMALITLDAEFEPNDPILGALPIYNHPDKKFIRDLPREGHAQHLVLSLKHGYWDSYLFPEESEAVGSKYGSYIAILGHWLHFTVPLIVKATTDRFNDALNIIGTQGGAYGTAVDNIENIVNWNSAGSQNFFEVPGWSMGKGLNFTQDKIKTIIIEYPDTWPIGSLSLGNYYQSEYSPDFGYDFNLLMDGQRYSQTAGGSTFSDTSYKGPANWISGGAWELGHYSDDDGDGVYEWQHASNMKRVGRREWDFTWSGFSDTQLMPNNMLAGIYPETERPEDRYNFYTQVLRRSLDQSFFFIPDGSNYSPDQFTIARWGKPSMEFSQTSYKIYSFSNSIVESW